MHTRSACRPRGRGAWMPGRQSMRVHPASSQTETAAPSAAPASGSGVAKVPWYDKSKELWLELESDDDFVRATAALPPNKLLFVDLYAGWCSVCKSAYPSMCRMAANPDLTQHLVFAKANIELAAVRQRIRSEGVPGIPWVCVYARGGGKVAGFGASFKKLAAVKANLATLGRHLHELPTGREWPVDPNGFLLPLADVASGAQLLSGGSAADV